mmetsp:Transcript_25854/g.31367  ORF Transcript_25854/g.31367 Transcript_25854/m.31367 type:complete len:493 (-) Transcript_25854:203-1681(-)|eukprot:CAMPEP_0197856966 /NCGR_PEP_ID=MMETSP1438-20131217/29570_1 /TAXON_ID=1461541 /ORGANISM="Pterosperma sp., Strain CCMP1384" /LENGTH=492 /DNA_ID=CAMNT_0043472617 /DNA_START=348 /DNA_END=1826 /DNA_ORIENTATION=+
MTGEGSRSAAIGECKAWLERGGVYEKGSKQKCRVQFNDAFEICGSESNVSLCAKKNLPAGTTVVAIARDLCLQPRNPFMETSGAAKKAKTAAKAIRGKCEFKTPLMDGSDQGRIDLMVLLALELLSGESSSWAPYLKTLPPFEACEVPSVWGLSETPPLKSTFLDDTSLSLILSRDGDDLSTVLQAKAKGKDGEGTWLMELLGAPSVESARSAFLHAVCLVSSRMVSGAGLVPILDLLNGCPSGHATGNTTIQFIKLPDGGLEAVAAQTKKEVKAGEELILEYGAFSASEFIYKYGFVHGDLSKPASTGEDKALLSAREIFSSPEMTSDQQAVLSSIGFDDRVPVLADELPSRSPFGIEGKRGPEGGIPKLLHQVATAACCENKSELSKAAASKSLVPLDSVTPDDVASKVNSWICARVHKLISRAEADLEAAKKDPRAHSATCICLGEASQLLGWMGGLQKKHQLDTSAFKECLKKQMPIVLNLRKSAAEL